MNRSEMRANGRSLAATACFIALIAACVVLPASEARATDSPTVVIDMSDLTSFVDSDGNPVSIDSDSTDGAERSIAGTLSDGDPVNIVVYLDSSTATDPTTTSDLVDLATTRADGTPPSAQGDPQEVDADGFDPTLVTAATPTTIAVAWGAPSGATSFDLSIDGQPLPTSSSPSFSETGLDPDTNYKLAMTSSHPSPATTPPSDPAPTAGCPAPVVHRSADLSAWDTAASSDSSASVVAGAALEVVVQDDPPDLAEGRFPLQQDLSSTSSASMIWSGSGPAPSVVLGIDFDADGTADADLSSIDATFSAWQLSAGAPSSLTATAPDDHADGTYIGSLTEWSTAFPTASITNAGYRAAASSSGSISDIAVGCAHLEFFSTGPAAEATVTDATSALDVGTLSLPAQSLSKTRRLAASRSIAVAAASVSPSVSSTEVNYRTFLPYGDLARDPNPADQGIVSACLALAFADPNSPGHGQNPLDYTFIGDGRGFKPPTGADFSYRTYMDYVVNWNTLHGEGSKSTGFTDIINKNTRDQLDERHAPTSHMTFDHQTHTSGYWHVTFDHVANDPFCPHLGAIGSITYRASISMYRSGLVTITGERFAMPDHEMWVRWNGEALWTNVLALQAKGLACLVLGAAAPWPPCRDSLTGSVSRSRIGWSSIRAGFLVTDRGQSWSDPNSGLSPILPIGYLCSAEFGPIPLPDSVPVKAGAARRQGVRLTTTGSLQTWTGSFPTTYLGRPDEIGGADTSGIPTDVDSRTYKSIATANNGQTTFGLTTGGDIYTFGRDFGWSVDGTTYNGVNPSPTVSLSGEHIKSFDVNDANAVAVDTAGHLWQMGYYDNSPSLYGWSGWNELSVPGVTFTQAVASNRSLYALDSNGHLWGWGYNDPTGSDPDWNWVTTPTQYSGSAAFRTLYSSPVRGWMGILDASGQEYYPGDGEVDVDAAAPIPAVYYDGADLIGTDGTWWTWSSQQHDWIDEGLPPTRTPPMPQVDCGSAS